MPAVVRIKRRIDEEPHSAFVLNGKRRRLHDDENAPAATPTPNTGNNEELSQVLLKFAGTLEKQDDIATKKFATARLNKAAAKELVMNNVDPSIRSSKRRERLRQEQQQFNRERRYRVVNCLRTTLNEHDEQEDEEQGQEKEEGAASSSQNEISTDQRQFTILDIESHHQQHQQPQEEDTQQLPSDQQQPADSDIGYVYDLYVLDNELQPQYGDMFDDNYLSLRPVNEIMFEDCYNDDEECDSEDSNDENYYTNDYPDEDDVAGMGSDEELCQQMNNFLFDDDDEEYATVSSDAEDHNEYHDPYVHTVDAESASFVDDVDNVERQGSAYERYKRRILREFEVPNSINSEVPNSDNSEVPNSDNSEVPNSDNSQDPDDNEADSSVESPFEFDSD